MYNPNNAVKRMFTDEEPVSLVLLESFYISLWHLHKGFLSYRGVLFEKNPIQVFVTEINNGRRFIQTTPKSKPFLIVCLFINIDVKMRYIKKTILQVY